MGGLNVARGLATGLIGVTTACFIAPAHAGDPAGFAPSYSGSQAMVYVRWSIGAHGARPDSFGLRYERSAPSYSDPAAQFCPPLRHHSLVDLQFVRGAAPRMLFGPKVTWDMGRGQLTPTSLAMRVWPMSIQPLTPSALASSVP